MKIRNGFVSNSSSSSFTFCFKGNDIKDLYKMIRKYKSHFCRSYDYYDDVFHCNEKDVIKEIEEARKSKDEFYKIEVKDIDDEISLAKVYMDEDKKYLKEAEESKDDNLTRLAHELWIAHHENSFNVEQAKKDGLNKVCVIEFGDSHGHIKGNNVGRAMDYDGRYINLKKKDFVVFTSNCH